MGYTPNELNNNKMSKLKEQETEALKKMHELVNVLDLIFSTTKNIDYKLVLSLEEQLTEKKKELERLKSRVKFYAIEISNQRNESDLFHFVSRFAAEFSK